MKNNILDMKNNMLEAVYIFNSPENNPEGIAELRILADGFEKRNGWVLAVWNSQVVGGVKEEYLKAFYLTSGN